MANLKDYLLQTTGQSKTKFMSQKAVTDAINGTGIGPDIIQTVFAVINDPSLTDTMYEGKSKWVVDGITYTWFGVWIEI